MNQYLNQTMALFLVLQLLNVITSTIKYVVTVKSTASVAAMVNALNYTISACVTYFIGKQDIIPVIIITFASNLIGVPIGKLVVDKMSKERLWVYNATIKCDEATVKSFKEALKEGYNISSTWETIAEDKMYTMQLFVNTKENSKVVKQQLAHLNAKYHIIEPR